MKLQTMYKVNLLDGVPALASNDNVVAAWAFGSGQTGEIRRGSDLDIAVLFATKPGLDEQIDLLLALQDAYGLEDVDLVVLNEASAILRFEAVSGRRLFCRDPERYATFVSLTAREYEHAIAMIERALAWRRTALQRQLNIV